MSQSYASLYFHCVWSTQSRFPFLISPFNSKAHNLIINIMQRSGARVLAIGGMPDHVHVLFSIKPSNVLTDVIRHAKGGSSKMLSELHIDLRQFAWQNGYAIFSVSKSNTDTVSAYIKNQERHHKERSFENEICTLLELHECALEKNNSLNAP